jgi:membrane protease YdiL (CAAX protease family)
MVSFVMAQAILWVQVQLFGLPLLNMATDYVVDGYGFGWLVLSTCLIPAVFEEIAFRGIIHTGLTRHLTVIEAALVGSAIFAILHLSVPSLPHLLVLGLMFTYLRIRSGSLVPGMIAHFLHNLVVCVTDWQEAGGTW